MSRTLSKILVICAMIVVLPLMIVGTAFAAYHSVGNIVGVEVVVDQASPAGNVYISYNGERKASHKISEGHTKTVNVTADTSAAYTFVGWYKGSAADYANETATLVSKEKTLKISMEEEKNYVAVYEVVKYNVSFSFQADPTNSDLTTRNAKTYIYGEELLTQADISTYTGSQFKFAGWQVEGQAAVESRYTTASFANVETGADVTLVNPWIESEKVTLTLDNNGTTTSKEVYKDDVLKVADLLKEIGVEAEVGYEYAWKDVATGLEFKDTISATANMTLQLVGPTAITYTAENVQFDANDFADGVSAGSVSFSVTDQSGFAKWFNLKTKYSFWTIDGISYKDVVYSNDKLADLAKAYAQDSTGAFSLHVTKNFNTVVVNGGIEFASTTSDVGIVYDEDVYVNGRFDPYIVAGERRVSDIENMTVAQWLMIDAEYLDGEILYTNLSDGKWSVKLKEIAVEVNGFKIETTEDEKLIDFIQKYYDKTSGNLSEVLDFGTIYAHFVPYERVEL